MPPYLHLPLSDQHKKYLSRFETLINSDMARLAHQFNCELWTHYEALQLMISRLQVGKPFKIWIDRAPQPGPFGFIFSETSLIPHFRERQPIPKPFYKYWANTIGELAQQIASTLPKLPGTVMVQPTLYEVRLFPFQTSNSLPDHQVVVIGGYDGPRIFQFPID